MLKAIPMFSALLLAVACSTQGVQSFAKAGSGNYELEKTHASLVWKVSHNGLSNYTARFTDFDATLDFNPNDPTESKVTATINPLSVETDHPTNDSWDTTLGTGRNWLNGEVFPDIVFESTSVLKTGEFTGIINGNLTLLGISKPVAFKAKYNGTGNAPWFGTRDIIGFSAEGTLKRSDFGMTHLLPNIGDEVTFIIEAEFVETE